jgi:oxygen-independent coproporphyrinogen-3 oxidase
MALPGLYLHIPFCHSKCPYCGFYSITDLAPLPSFLGALAVEMALYRERFPAFDTVYIGGGTPSVLAVAQLEAIIGEIRKTFALPEGVEITVEINPGDATPGFLQASRRSGVSRLNVGVQSFDDDVLAFLGRRHTSRQAVETILLAREAGFDSLGLDLIYGLGVVDRKEHADSRGERGGPAAKSLFSRWQGTLEVARSFGPEHLSCYELTVEAGTPLAERIATGSHTLPDEDLQCRYFLRTSEVLEEAGYIHYEVSNFAREERFRSRHNSKYWDHTPYLGLGPAAHSFDGTRRWWNHRNVALYIQQLHAGKRPVAGEETLGTEQLRLEALCLGLRTAAGIDIREYRENYGTDLSWEWGEVIERLVAEGHLERRENRLAPTRKGLAVADAMARLLS